MCRPYALIVGIAFAVLGCTERGEVIARERTLDAGAGGAAGAHASGGSGTNTGGLGCGAGAPSGGGPGARPQLSQPVPVAELNDPVAKDGDPTLTEDELEIFFFSDRNGDEDLWKSTRESIDAAWDEPMLVQELNSDKLDQNPSISRDGLRIWFSSNREPAGNYYASRPSRDEPFGTPELIPIQSGSTEGSVIAPSVDVTELRMAVSIGTGASRDIYELVRPSLMGSWGAPALLPGVNGTNAESTPFLIDDGRELLFISGRSGGGDLYWAYRESLALPTVLVEPLTEVNDPTGFESHPHLTVDRARLYFGSDRGGNTDIYVAEVL
jgi:hypothetical protein